uniref:Toxin 30 isoform S1 n=1 Tax=Cupiennius salei TaxID=6928 RepID=A0A4Y5UGP4_CUPSA|nr:toxin 30 isoform S1 precursor [Cupiennius salei]QDC23139.1 toxin 30 isoform S2 precursor [Cupiennius salei]
MKLFIFLVLLFITIVHCEDEIPENEADAEEKSPVAQEEIARDCVRWRRSCMGNQNGCCLPWRCFCWSQTVSRGSTRTEQKCQCRFW